MTQMRHHLRPAGFFRRHRRKWLVVLVLFSLAVTDVTLAWIYRLAEGHAFHVGPWRAGTASPHRIASAEFHHTLKPNMAVEQDRWGDRRYPTWTNALGFRSRLVGPVPLVGQRHRILFMGDSFTEGVGVRYRDSFVGRVDAALEARGIEVLNAAVVSYSPLIYWRKTRHLLESVGLHLDDLAVFIDISDVHDEVHRYRLAGGDRVVTIQDADADPMRRLQTRLRRNTMLTWFAWKLLFGEARGAAGRRDADGRSDQERTLGLGNAEAGWTRDDRQFDAWGRRGLASAERHMNALHDLVASRGIRLLVAVYPWPDQIVHNDLESTQVVFWRQWADQRDVPFLNLFPLFVCADATAEDQRAVLEAHYIARDVHWNEAGHRAVADAFLRFYDQAAGGAD